MKIEFEDKSYIEVRQNKENIIIIIQAKDHENHLKKITNAVEISLEEFKKLIKEIKL